MHSAISILFIALTASYVDGKFASGPIGNIPSKYKPKPPRPRLKSKPSPKGQPNSHFHSTNGTDGESGGSCGTLFEYDYSFNFSKFANIAGFGNFEYGNEAIGQLIAPGEGLLLSFTFGAIFNITTEFTGNLCEWDLNNKECIGSNLFTSEVMSVNFNVFDGSVPLTLDNLTVTFEINPPVEVHAGSIYNIYIEVVDDDFGLGGYMFYTDDAYGGWTFIYHNITWDVYGDPENVFSFAPYTTYHLYEFCGSTAPTIPDEHEFEISMNSKIDFQTHSDYTFANSIYSRFIVLFGMITLMAMVSIYFSPPKDQTNAKFDRLPAESESQREIVSMEKSSSLYSPFEVVRKKQRSNGNNFVVAI